MGKLSQFELTTAIIRKSAEELRLTSTEKTVLVTMSTFLPTIKCSHSTVASLSGLSTKSVQRSVAVLVDKGYLSLVEKHDSRLNKASTYKLGNALNCAPSYSELDLSWSPFETTTHSFKKYNAWWTSEAAADEAKKRSGM